MKPWLSSCGFGLTLLVAHCGNETVEEAKDRAPESHETGGTAAGGEAGGQGGEGQGGGNSDAHGGNSVGSPMVGTSGGASAGGGWSGNKGGASSRSSTGGVAGMTGTSGGTAGTSGVLCTKTVEGMPLPRIVFVQDLSSSMRSQWQSISDTMVSLVNEVGAKAQLGFVPFSSVYLDNASEIAQKYAEGGAEADAWFADFYRLNDGDCNISESSITLPVVGNAATVSGAYRAVIAERMVGGTPTYLAITKAQHVLVEHAPSDGSKGYAFLITDGDPNCDSPTTDRIADVETAIMELARYEVKTYVFAYRYYQAFALQRWAIAGGSERYYNAENATELREALSRILGTLVPCE